MRGRARRTFPSILFRKIDSFSLQEIEKVEDPKALYSLLMPWELGEFI
jgi:hypothetical protein